MSTADETILFCRMASDVTIRHREVDVRAVPYDTPTSVWDPGEERLYTESIAPEAFTQRPIRPNRIPVLRDHDDQRIAGHCRTIKPDRPDGLHATFAMSRTLLGDESLELARDGTLHVSIGFWSVPDHDEWSVDRERVVRRSCILREISLVPFPAYEGAEVLAVRRQVVAPVRVATPNLDRIRALRLAEKYDQLEVRMSRQP